MSKRPYTAEEWNEISVKLQKQLGPEYLAQRPGPSGRPLTYIEGKTAINIANDIFGFNGWSTDIRDTTVDFVDVSSDNKYSVGISVTIRITLLDGSYHEDMGYGSDQNAKSKSTAFEKARKQAVTDATKRTLRYFGNSLGNCLYDNPYLSGIGKMAKPTIKFTAKNLYRHDQFNAPKQGPTPQQLRDQPKPQPQQPFAVRSSKPIAHESVSPHNSVSTVKSIPEPVVPKSTTQEPKNEPMSVVENDYVSAALFEPIVPEDSFTYEGDEDLLVQMLANDDEEGLLDDDEILAGIITPPPQTSSYSSAPGSQNAVRREAPLSDLDEHNNKRSCIERI